MGEQGHPGGDPGALGPGELPKEITDALELITLEATSSHTQNLAAAQRHRKIVAGLLERCKRLDSRIKQMGGTNSLLRRIKERDKTAFEARISDLTSQIDRLTDQHAREIGETVDERDKIYDWHEKLRKQLEALNKELAALRRTLDERDGELAAARHDSEASRRETDVLRTEIAALQDVIGKLRAGREELEQQVLLRQAQLEVRNLILRLTLENTQRRHVMAEQANNEPEDGGETSGFGKKILIPIGIVVAGLLAAFLSDKFASHGIWMGLEASIALVVVLITVFSRLAAYQGSALVIGGGPGRGWIVENISERPADPAKALSDKEKAKADADKAVADHLAALTAHRETLKTKSEAHATATAALQQAALAARPEAEMAPLRTAVQAAQAQKDAAQAALTPVEAAHTQLEAAAKAADDALVQAKANMPKNPSLDWTIRPLSCLAAVMTVFVLVYDCIDGNRFVHDGLEPRGCESAWMTSEETIPTRRIVANDLPGDFEVMSVRVVPNGRGGYELINVVERFDNRRLNDGVTPRLERQSGLPK